MPLHRRHGRAPSRRATTTGAVLAVLLAGCTGSATPAPSTPASAAATAPPATSSQEAPASASPSTPPTPSPSPTPEPILVGVGTARVTGDDGSFVDTDVAGDCLVAGSGLPDSSEGSIVEAEVEPYIALDNYLGPDGGSSTPQPVVLAVDDNDGVIGVALYGGPSPDWSWWSGDITELVLADPLDDDGVTIATLRMTATLARDETRRPNQPAPRPAPSPTPAPTATTPPAPTATPAAAAAASDAGPSTARVQQVAQEVEPTPMQALELAVEVSCTLVP